MNVKIGAKIKELRTRDGVTQERLAEALGVTSQAVSKWESESGYPDIEYITPIANFFNVATDYLFNHDSSEKLRKIDEYCRRCDVRARNCASVQERIEILRQALAEFPAEERLLFLLAEALYDKSKKDSGYIVHGIEKAPEEWKESATILERLLAESVDDSIRAKCRYHLALMYGRIGENEKVIKIAENCDPIIRSRQVLLAAATQRGSNEKRMYQQEAAIALLVSLCDIISNVADIRINHAAKDDILKDYIRIEEYYIMTDIYTKVNKFIFESGSPDDSNENYYGINRIIKNLYFSYASILINEGEVDEAYEKLNSAYKYAKNYDERLKKNGGRIKSSNGNEESRILPELLYALKCDRGIIEIPGDPRYTELIRKIEADIAGT